MSACIWAFTCVVLSRTVLTCDSVADAFASAAAEAMCLYVPAVCVRHRHVHVLVHAHTHTYALHYSVGPLLLWCLHPGGPTRGSFCIQEVLQEVASALLFPECPRALP